MLKGDPCGHNDHMASRLVGARELKVRLGTYLKRVRHGQTLIVTDRGLPVAELRPLSGARGDEAILTGLAAQGAVTLPETVRRLRSIQPVRCVGETASRAVLDEREDRF